MAGKSLMKDINTSVNSANPAMPFFSVQQEETPVKKGEPNKQGKSSVAKNDVPRSAGNISPGLPVDINLSEEELQMLELIREKNLKPNDLQKKPETKSRRAQLLLKPSLYEKLKQQADDAGDSLNEYIHQLLETAVLEKSQ